MKTVLSSEVISTGGRSGSVASSDGQFETDLGNPLDADSEQDGPTPEMFFAAAYSACYHGAVLNAAKKMDHTPRDSKVRAVVNLMEADDGGYLLEVELHAHLPGLSQEETRRIMAEADKTCPYSKALRGWATVQLVADDVDPVQASRVKVGTL